MNTSITILKNVLSSIHKEYHTLRRFVKDGKRIFDNLYLGGQNLSMPLFFTIYDIVDYYFGGKKDRYTNKEIADKQKKFMMYAMHLIKNPNSNFIVFPERWPLIFINKKYFESLIRHIGLRQTLKLIKELCNNSLSRYFNYTADISSDPIIETLIEYLEQTA